MQENNEKSKSITYIKNEKYLFNIIKIIRHSTINIEKIGITIYKKTLEINIINKDCIDLLLNINSNNFIESYANIGFINLYGILCFLYASNNDVKEKEKINIGNNNIFKIYRINNIHCIIISYYVPSKLKKLIKEEVEKISKFLVGELLYFCKSPYRYDYDISSQLNAFQNNSFKYKLCERFQYNEDFSPHIFKNVLTPLVKGFYKHITYNNLFNDNDYINIAIRYKIYDNNKYLIQVEMFITPNANKIFFQNIFYIYYNESSDKISFLNKIIEDWNNYTKNNNNKKINIQNEGLIFNFYKNAKNDKNEDSKNNSIKTEITKNKNIDFINIKFSKIENVENILNSNIAKLKNVGYNYQYSKIDYFSQNKILIMMINDLNLFSLAKYVSCILYEIFLSDRGNIQKNVINNAKEEILKQFKAFDKKIKKFQIKFPIRFKLNFIKDEEQFKNEIDEKNNLKSSQNLNNNNKKYIMIDSSNKEDEGFIIVDSVDNYDKTNNDQNNDSDNDNEEKLSPNKDLTNEKNNNINIINLNIEKNKIKEEINLYEDLYNDINLDENINIDENKNHINNKEKINNDGNKINNQITKLNNLVNKNNTITIFIGTFNVNALESDLIKLINLEQFLFPDKLKNYFIPQNIPTFYCLGLEETIELNAKNVIIKPKNKAELWEERISKELQKKYNYFLQCKQQLVGVLLLFYVKATEIKHISNIHVEKLKSGFMGCGNKGCCFFEFNYKKLSYGFCSCHLPAGQNKKNFLDRKETFKHILDFKVNKNIYEFYKNDFFFIFGDLNFRTNKIGLVDLQNHIKIILSERKSYKEEKNNKKIRFSLELNPKKMLNKHKKLKSGDISFDNTKKHEKEHNNVSSDKNMNSYNYKKKKEKKEIEDYSNYNSNKIKGSDKKKSSCMEENIFIEYFLNEFLEDEELKKLKENELFEYDVEEADITFPPTYKYVKGTDLYNLSKRVPSWTDRILYKRGSKITPIFYDRILINFSDHKPIVGLFEIDVGE